MTNFNNNQPQIPRMRTEYHIRRLVLDGVLPRIKAGKKYLINLDSLLEYFNGKAG